MKKRILNTIAAGTLILSLGVLSGCGSDLKSKNENIQIVAVEPASSPVLSEGRAGAHKI